MKDRDHNTRPAKKSKKQTEKRLNSQASPPHRLFSPEEILAPEQKKYRLLAESAPLGIAVVGNNGRYQYLNPKFVDMFGYTLEDIPTGQEWFAQAYPDAAYRDQVIADWKLYLQESQVGEAEPGFSP